MKSNINNCDFCGQDLMFVYKPINSVRKCGVYLCKSCGLLQSIYPTPYQPPKQHSLSCDADRASIMYTKDMIIKKHLSIIQKHCKNFTRILDIGSNRGAFLREVLKISPEIYYVGVEPKHSIVCNCAGEENVHVFNQRFENFEVHEQFSFIYCAHTLEHLNSAKEGLFKIYDLLSVGGLAFIAVPQFCASLCNDYFEEFFIDTHTFHFTYVLLERFLTHVGFEIIDSSNKENSEIYFVLRKKSDDTSKGISEFIGCPEYAQSTYDLIGEYVDTINSTRSNLKKLSSKLILQAKNKKIIVWGAGRILYGLLSIGKLDVSKIYSCVDTYLYKYADRTLSLEIHSPQELITIENKRNFLIFIASRAHCADIAVSARDMGFTHILSYPELVDNKLMPAVE